MSQDPPRPLPSHTYLIDITIYHATRTEAQKKSRRTDLTHIWADNAKPSKKLHKK